MPTGACGLELQRDEACVEDISDHLNGDNHARAPSQPTERISDALHPSVLLIQQPMPPRGTSPRQDPSLCFNPPRLGFAALIAWHNSHLLILPSSFTLPACTSE
jgi:hypothetical protein